MKTSQMPRHRFKIIAYTNQRTGSKSWRVTGTRRNGSRVRENFSNSSEAQHRHIELEAEFFARHTESTLRATRLTEIQTRLAELAFSRLDDDADMPRAIDHWLKGGKQQHVATSLRVDEAFEKFKAWLDGKANDNGNGNGHCTLREHSRNALRIRVNVFANGIGNLRINEIIPDTVEDFLGKLKVSNTTRDNYRRAISRFFSWCIQRPRRWTLVNPCREIRIEKGEKAPPAILSVEECQGLLEAASREKLTAYVAVCLFAGLRPFEVSRLTWDAVNLKDCEIRLEGNQTKTGRPRVVSICNTLLAWLKTHEGQDFFPSNWRKAFDRVKLAAGFGTPDEKNKDAKLRPWPVDVMRHTAISHYFRKTGSYGQTAEQFGNSEAIIKAHYQSRVSSADTKKFYLLKPAKQK